MIKNHLIGPLKQYLARTFQFKDLFAKFWGLQTLWPYQLTKPDFSDLGYFPGMFFPKRSLWSPFYFLPIWKYLSAWQVLKKSGISISTQPFLMKMCKKRKFNKNVGIFQHLTCSFGILRCHPFSFTGSVNAWRRVANMSRHSLHFPWLRSVYTELNHAWWGCRLTWVGLLLILPPFTEVCYCVYTIKNLTSVKLKQNQGKHSSWKHGLSQLEPYWGLLALGRFCTELAELGPYCHDLGPILPSAASRSVSKRLVK